jgi:hypothetical protein
VEHHGGDEAYDDSRQGKSGALKKPRGHVIGGVGRDALRIGLHPW